jgi:transcription initiation factor TFIID subunit 13
MEEIKESRSNVVSLGREEPPREDEGDDEELKEYESEEEDLKIQFVPTDINYKRRKRLFTRDLRPMMYGFGDAPQTLPSTVDLMEEMVLEYIIELVQRAGELGCKRGRFRTEDLIFLVRKDPKKYARIEELLYMNEELKRARRAFELEDYEKTHEKVKHEEKEEEEEENGDAEEEEEGE